MKTLAACVAALTLVLVHPGTGDYSPHDLTNPDDAAPAIEALLHGRFGDLPDDQPLMGLVTILGRVPFAALGDAFGGTLAVYRFGAFACLWVLAFLALTLARSLLDVSRIGAVAVVALIMFNPATTKALEVGHPEELVLAATACAAVWLSVRRRERPAGVLSGLAIGTKPFGALALLPSLAAAGPHRRTVLAVGLVVGLLFTLPLPLLSPSTYLDGSRALAGHKRVYATSIWWPIGDNREIALSTGQGREIHQVRIMPAGLSRGTGTIAAGLFAIALTLLAARRRGEALGADALALLAAIFFARAFLDPQNLGYYSVAAFTGLIAWEVVARRRPPLLGTLAVGFAALTFHSSVGYNGLQAAVYLLWILPLTAYLTTVVIRRT